MLSRDDILETKLNIRNEDARKAAERRKALEKAARVVETSVEYKITAMNAGELKALLGQIPEDAEVVSVMHSNSQWAHVPEPVLPGTLVSLVFKSPDKVLRLLGEAVSDDES